MGVAPGVPPQTELDRYVTDRDDALDLQPVAVRTGPSECGVHELVLTSQRWRGVLWRHRMWCVLPPRLSPGGLALLWIRGSGEPTRELELAAAVAVRSRAPVALLADVPNQPLFEGLTEDALIAHTFDAFLRTGEPDWPLLLPMTKAAVCAMDALEVFVERQTGLRCRGFLVTGASKRGWTAWLAAAVDPRVQGVAPMVYDNLCLDRQRRRQREVFDNGYSPQWADYVARDILERWDTPRGQQLRTLVDPYTYRDRLTLPKWVLLGTNDPYWPVDALSLYAEELPGSLYVTYVPNAGHSLDPPDRVVAALLALFAVCGHREAGAVDPLPPLAAAVRTLPTGLEWEMPARGTRAQARRWSAQSPTPRFDAACWEASPLPGPGPWHDRLSPAPGRWQAAFLEIEVPHPLLPAATIPLATPARCLGPGEA